MLASTADAKRFNLVLVQYSQDGRAVCTFGNRKYVLYVTNTYAYLPASGMCLMQLPMTYPSATGMMCVTPSPASITVPVSVRSLTCVDHRRKRTD